MVVTSEPKPAAGETQPATPGSPGPTGLPRRSVRWLAFIAIVVGGALGAVIGSGLANAGCDTDCGTTALVGALIGGIACAIGVGIVATLVLRAMREWHTIQDRDSR